MKIISFGWTAPAIVARAKTVTRREWDDRYAFRFRHGEIVQAFDRSPRYGGKRIALIRLTEIPYKENLANMPDGDYAAEGFEYLHKHPELISPSGKKMFGDCGAWALNRWRKHGGEVWVIHFEYADDEEKAINES